MNDKNKAYLMEVREINLEEMENKQQQIVTRLRGVLADVKRSLQGAEHGDFNSIDTMCSNVSGDLIRILRDSCEIKERRTENSTISLMLKD